MVIENVRQLRHRADDACPGWAEGKHTYDRKKGCRQLRKADLCGGMGWGWENMASCLILRGRAAEEVATDAEQRPELFEE